jgi:hypothetical protein
MALAYTCGYGAFKSATPIYFMDFYRSTFGIGALITAVQFVADAIAPR